MDGKRLRKCLRCGAEFAWTRTTARYCSDKCSKSAYAERKRAEKEARTIKVDVVCANPACGKTIKINPSARKVRNFCCVECLGIWRKSTQDKRICASCGQSFGVPRSKPMQKFCSKTCGYAFQTKERQRETARRQAIMEGSYREMGRGKGEVFEHDIFSGPEIWVEWVGPDERDEQTPEGSGVSEEIPAAVRAVQEHGGRDGGADLPARRVPGRAVGMVQGF